MAVNIDNLLNEYMNLLIFYSQFAAAQFMNKKLTKMSGILNSRHTII